MVPSIVPYFACCLLKLWSTIITWLLVRSLKLKGLLKIKCESGIWDGSIFKLLRLKKEILWCHFFYL